MPPVSFSVSEVRVAASCPRILYFDAEETRRGNLWPRAMTYIWKASNDDSTACGSVFHHAVERFNLKARRAPEVRAVLDGPDDPEAIERGLRTFLNGQCIDLDALARKDVRERQAFVHAIAVYMRELAQIVAYARSRGKPAGEILDQMFGDRRRRVEVTFPVGPAGEPVHVTGILDYVFYDWRTESHRIIDYKLTPADQPTKDLFQVSLYALMHHHQHHTHPDVGVLYLHPERKVFELSWEKVEGHRHRVYDLLASMAAWVVYDETSRSGLKPPGEPSLCAVCKWNRGDECVRRLGPKHEGQRLSHWSDAASKPLAAIVPEPAILAHEIPEGPAPILGPIVLEGPVSSLGPVMLQGTVTSHGPVELHAHVTESAHSTISHTRVSSTPAPIGSAEKPTAPGSDSLRIGTTVNGGHPVGLPLSALPTHVAVVGAAGSGKTYMAKVVVEEAIRQGVPVLAIDPQGDLVQFLRAADEPPGLSEDAKALRRAFLERVETRVWTPGSSHGRRLSLDPIRLTSPDRLQRFEPARREEEWEGILANAASHLVASAKVGGEEDSQQTFLLQLLRKMTRSEGGSEVDLRRIAEAVKFPEENGMADPDQFIKKTEREKLARKLNALRLGPSAGLYSGGTRLDLDALCRAEGEGKTPLNVIYLNALAGDDQKHFFVASLASEIYRWMVTSLDPNPNGRPNLLVYLDEARDYIPAGTLKPPAKLPLIRLFTQGRKYGVACLLCTQSPRSVDYNVFGNCSTKLIGRLESVQDQETVAKWFGNEGKPPWLAGRKGARAGDFVARWPEMSRALEGRAIRSRTLFSLHEGAWSPDRLEREMALDSARHS